MFVTFSRPFRLNIVFQRNNKILFFDLLLCLEWSCLDEYFFHAAESTVHMFCWIWYFCDMFALVDTCSMSANFLVCLEKKVLTLSPIRMQSSVMQFYFFCDMNFMWASMTISYQYLSPPPLYAFLGHNVSIMLPKTSAIVIQTRPSVNQAKDWLGQLFASFLTKRTTKQQGNPSESFLLTSEKAVFCKMLAIFHYTNKVL